MIPKKLALNRRTNCGEMMVAAVTVGPRLERGEETLANLITRIGRPGFEDALLIHLNAVVGADLAGIFLFGPDAAPIDWLVADNHTGIAARATGHFLKTVWPRNHCAFGIDLRDIQDIGMRRQNACEITDSEHRKLCYHDIGVADRLALYERCRRGAILVCAYRFADSGKFRQRDCDALSASAACVLAACNRHITLSRGRAVLVEDSDALGGSALSRREAQVADLIAAGASSRVIAEELDISIHTVQTYRKRVYEKLRVGTQRELLAQRYAGVRLPR